MSCPLSPVPVHQFSQLDHVVQPSRLQGFWLELNAVAAGVWSPTQSKQPDCSRSGPLDAADRGPAPKPK